MPVPFDIDKAPQENVWYVHQNEICSNFTGSTLYSINYLNEQFFNSNLSEGFYRKPFDAAFTHHNLSNKKFLKYDNILSEQFSDLSAYFEDIPLSEVKSLTSSVVSFLLNLLPDAFTLELTGEKSIFYTIKKDNMSFYIQQYFEIDEDDGFNATFVKFQDDKKLSSLNGEISHILSEIESHFSNTNSAKLNLAYINDLSY